MSPSASASRSPRASPKNGVDSLNVSRSSSTRTCVNPSSGLAAAAEPAGRANGSATTNGRVHQISTRFGPSKFLRRHPRSRHRRDRRVAHCASPSTPARSGSTRHRRRRTNANLVGAVEVHHAHHEIEVPVAINVRSFEAVGEASVLVDHALLPRWPAEPRETTFGLGRGQHDVVDTVIVDIGDDRSRLLGPILDDRHLVHDWPNRPC